MLKNVIVIVLFLLSALNAKSQSEVHYSNWLFIQSDKALQYRIAVIKMEGDIASLQLQFRVNNEDGVYCKSSMCDGMLLSLSNKNVGDKESTKYSFVFDKSFIGLENIYTWPQLLTTELKTWPDGSKRFWSVTRGIVYTNAGSDEEYDASVPYCCVDVRLGQNPDNHRCGRHGFDFSTAVTIK